MRESSAKNINHTLENTSAVPIAEAAVRELLDRKEWDELNDRFYKTLAFGTGGLRGRTVARIVTAAEKGLQTGLIRPEFPCVGTNAMNYANVRRATIGLVNYIKKWLSENAVVITGKPKIVIAYDTRLFSREFAELTAKTAIDFGFDAALFDAPRSTPELSFAVRYLNAMVGVVITASHNPSYDNGYKVYFQDGAQLIEPHASGMIQEVNAVHSLDNPNMGQEKGKLTLIGTDIDHPYLERLETLVLNPQLLKSVDLKVVYTPIHGTGAVMIIPALEHFGIDVIPVKEQMTQDGRFPTVNSPNPENAEALNLGIELAKMKDAHLVIGTDPDCDRMGVAVRSSSTGDAQFTLLTGNQIGSLIAYYRLETLFQQGILNDKNRNRATLIKTFVTTDLQKEIAKHFGVRCVDTLTGFKYIGHKLDEYEHALPEDKRANYRKLTEAETRDLRLKDSTYFVFGGEESYGYSGADFVRDKDANAAAVMFAEVAAYAKSRGITVIELLDEIYQKFGFYAERGESLVMEGAEGATQIQKLLESYATHPPKTIAGHAVAKATNFAKEEIYDEEGEKIPAEKMFLLEFEEGGKVAIRGSGTEPKLKYYLFASAKPKGDLQQVKANIQTQLADCWKWLKQDAQARLEN